MHPPFQYLILVPGAPDDPLLSLLCLCDNGIAFGSRKKWPVRNFEKRHGRGLGVSGGQIYRGRIALEWGPRYVGENMIAKLELVFVQ